MQASDLEEEQDTVTLESLPNELLLLIFCHKTQSIINENDVAQAQEEFKVLLPAICLSKKRFYQFKDDLEKYFDLHKRPEISEVILTIDEEADEYNLSFTIREHGIEYKFFANADKRNVTNKKFADDIINISDITLEKVGFEIAGKIKEESDLTFIWSLILTRPYRQAINEATKMKIRALVNPIFDKYSNKDHGVYKSGLSEYQE